MLYQPSRPAALHKKRMATKNTKNHKKGERRTGSCLSDFSLFVPSCVFVARSSLGDPLPANSTYLHGLLRHEVLLNVQLGRTEVDQQASLHSGRAQVTEQLGDMLVEHSPASFDLNYQATFDEQVCVIVSEDSAILIIHAQWELLLDRESLFPQSVRQRVLVDLLKVPVAVVFVNSKARFPDDVTERIDVGAVHRVSPLSYHWRPWLAKKTFDCHEKAQEATRRRS